MVFHKLKRKKFNLISSNKVFLSLQININRVKLLNDNYETTILTGTDDKSTEYRQTIESRNQ